MKKIIILIVGIALLTTISSCNKKSKEITFKSEQKSFLPQKLKIIKEGGISVRESSDGKSSIISAAHKDYSYDVTDGISAYYKIKFINDQTGWICSNPAENWTELTSDNKVKILLKGGISVREKPYDKEGQSLGVAAEQYTFDILEAEYSYLKIALPENKSGWIYIGKPGERWVEFINE